MMQNHRPVAFFDIDGTLFRSSLLIELTEALLQAGVFPKQAREAIDVSYRSWYEREGSYETYVQSAVKVYQTNIKGVHYGTVKDIGSQVVALQEKHVYRFTRDLIQEFRTSGYYLVAVSKSPKSILDTFCEHYGFDKVYGYIYEIGPQDKFTGEVADAYLIENKGAIAQRVFQKKTDLSRQQSVAVGDTESDIPLLQSVARPICFNPNQQLYTHAHRHGWEVMVERKDVIYTIPTKA